MKKNKVITSMAAVALVLSLAACGKSTTDSSTTTSDADSVSSHKVAKSSKSTSSTSKDATSNDNSSSETSNNKASSTAKNSSSTSASAQSVNKTNTSSNSSTSTEAATFTAADARTVLKQHFGNQAGNNQQDASTTQSQVDAVDNLAASYNGDNTWTLSGTVNGQQVSYTVSQYGVQ